MQLQRDRETAIPVRAAVELLAAAGSRPLVAIGKIDASGIRRAATSMLVTNGPCGT